LTGCVTRRGWINVYRVGHVVVTQVECDGTPKHRRRKRKGRSRLTGRDKPGRGKSEKRIPLKQRISDAEAEIARINGIIAKIDTALALPDLFKRDPKQAAQLGKARAGAASALQRAEEEWLAVSSQYDEATG